MRLGDEINPRLSYSLNFTQQSLGTILKTREDTGTTGLGVYIPKLMMGIDASKGSFDSSVTIKKNKILNSKNKNFTKGSVKIKNYVEIPYLSTGNQSVPQFRKGEKVSIFYADDDIKSIAILPYGPAEPEHRKTDILEMGVPAKKGEKDEVTPENKYRLVFDSENKIIGIVMTKDNGEVSSYRIVIDGDEGYMQLADEKRSITIDTKKDIISMINENESSFIMEKKTITLVADTINFEARKEYNIKTENLNTKTTTIKTEADTQEEKISTIKREGNTLSEKINDVKREGAKSEDAFSTIIHDGDIISNTGVTSVKALGFKTGKGAPVTPLVPQIDESGAANFGTAAPAGMDLMRADPTISVLMAMGSKLDVLAGMLGAPPTSVAAITSSQVTMKTARVKG